MKTKHISILSIPCIDEIALSEAKTKFEEYKDNDTITNCDFDDDVWALCDEYANYNFNFKLDKFEEYGKLLNLSEEEFKSHLKTYIVYRMGDLSLGTLQSIISGIKKIVSTPRAKLTKIAEDLSMIFINRLTEFFSLLPCDEDTLDLIIEDLETVDEIIQSQHMSSQRKMAQFESYFIFNDIINMYWNNASDEDEKLFFSPLYFWWKITAIIGLRPREFVLTPRHCLSGNQLILRRNKIKGTNKTKSYKISEDYKLVKYEIPETLISDIEWYLDKTKNEKPNKLNTLFITSNHYNMWNHTTPINSRYFTYTNLRTCLRYFYEKVVSEQFGYKIVYDREISALADDEIQYLHLGDTRHLALINMIAEGTTPLVAMEIAGHDNPEMTAHYYSNIATFVECKTYRQYKKMLKGETTYSLSKPVKSLQIGTYVKVPEGRCYSKLYADGIYDDCLQVIGPLGEIGFCKNCMFFRSEDKAFAESAEIYTEQIKTECKNLEEVVNLYRKHKGEKEDINKALLKLKSRTYTYQQYLEETYGQEEKH